MKNVLKRNPAVAFDLEARYEKVTASDQEGLSGRDAKTWMQEHGYW